MTVISVFGATGLDTGIRIQNGASSTNARTSGVTITGNTNVNTGGIVVSNVTASLPAKFDANKKLQSGAIDLSGAEVAGIIAQARLADTAVTPGTYGDATHVSQVTVDQKGHVTSASNVLITGSGGTSVLVNGTSVSNPNFTNGSIATFSVANVTNITVNPTNIANAQVSATAAIDISKLSGAAASATTISAGAGLSGGGSLAANRTLTLDGTTFVNNFTLWDSSQAIRTWTAGLSGATDPVWTFGNNSADLTTGVLKYGGNTVATLTAGVLPAAQFPSLTGDVTTAGGALATTIANNAVTTSKINASAVTEAKLGLTDVTTANVSTSAHGLAPKGDNNAAHYLDGTGAYSTPSGSGANWVASGATNSTLPGTASVYSLVSSNSITVGSGTSAGLLQLGDSDNSNAYFIQATNAMTTNIVETIPVAPYPGLLYWTLKSDGTNVLRNATNTLAGLNGILGSSIPDGTRTITINGTTFGVTSSAGAQDLSANRTWTLDFDRTATLGGNPGLAAGAVAFATTGLIFEGATPDGFEGLLTTSDPTADRTWTMPDADTKIPIASQVLTFAGPTSARTITFPDAAITVARTDASQTFTGTETITQIDMGNTDTSITRASAGDINIEGNIAYRAGGTDVAIADGGTGQSTANAGLDALNQTAEASVASASTTDLGAQTSQMVQITGTVTITSFGTVSAGTTRWVRFAGALTLTHNGSSLILPNAGNNITTAAGDRLKARSLGSGNWLVYDYVKSDGTPLVSGGTTINATGGPIFASTADQTVANTTTETTLFGSGVGTKTLAANYLVAGKTITVVVRGRMGSKTVSPGSLTIKVKLGSTVIWSGAVTPAASLANDYMEVKADITCRTAGASGTVFGQAILFFNDGVTTAVNAPDGANTGTSTIDTTVTQVVDVTATWATADANNTITGSIGIISDGTGGSVTNSGGALTSNAIVLGAGNNDTKVVAGITTDGVNKITATTFDLGNTDTTIARASAGDINVEGNLVYRAGGTDVPVTDGGTGLSAGTSGGVPYFSGSTTIASSAALAANALVVGGGAGAAPSTTTTGSGVVTALGVAVNTAGGFSPIDGTATLSNKRISARITTITSSATPTVNTDNADCVTITALAAAITSMTTNLSGTPVNFDQLEFRIKDDGTARAITWGATFVAGPTALPTTTTISKALHVYFEWDAVQSKWVCMSAGSDA